MFGSIGHAAGDTESLSQRSSGHINEVQPDEDVLVVDAVYPLSAKLYNLSITTVTQPIENVRRGRPTSQE